MKIAQVVCRFKPYKGGISNVAYDYSLGLAKLGHKVTVFTPLYEKTDNEFTSSDFVIKRLLPWGKFGNAAFLPQLFWQLRNFDIIHLHYPFFGGAEIVWLLKLIKGKKMKLVLSYQMDVFGTGLMGKFFAVHTRILMPRIIQAADKVLVTSMDYAANSKIAKIIKKQPDKFRVLPLGVDLGKFFPTDKDKTLVEKFKIIPGTDRILLFVGALDKAHYFKGLDFLIQSFDLLDSSFKLVVVGSGELKATYEALVEKNDLKSRIMFTGSVSDNDLPKYYNLADIVVLPSVDGSEAFGLTLIEAMVCAKPVVAANLPGVRSVFDNNSSGFVFRPLDADDLINSLERLGNNEELRRSFGQNARAKAQKLYDHNLLVGELEHIYENCLNK